MIMLINKISLKLKIIIWIFYILKIKKCSYKIYFDNNIKTIKIMCKDINNMLLWENEIF